MDELTKIFGKVKERDGLVLDDKQGKSILCVGVGVTFDDEIVCIWDEEKYRVSQLYFDDYEILHISEQSYGYVVDRNIQNYNESLGVKKENSKNVAKGIRMICWMDGDITSYKKGEKVYTTGEKVVGGIVGTFLEIMSFFD